MLQNTLLEIEYVFEFLIKCYADYQRKFCCRTELSRLDRTRLLLLLEKLSDNLIVVTVSDDYVFVRRVLVYGKRISPGCSKFPPI